MAEAVVLSGVARLRAPSNTPPHCPDGATDVPSPAHGTGRRYREPCAGRWTAGARYVRSRFRDQPDQAAEANGSASFSTNGNDPGGFGDGPDGSAEGGTSSPSSPRRCRPRPQPNRRATPKRPSSAASRTSTRSAPVRRSRRRSSASSPRKMSRASTPGPTARSSGSSSSGSDGSRRAASSSRSDSRTTERSSAVRSRRSRHPSAPIAPTSPNTSGASSPRPIRSRSHGLPGAGRRSPISIRSGRTASPGTTEYRQAATEHAGRRAARRGI